LAHLDEHTATDLAGEDGAGQSRDLERRRIYTGEE
jgi:hypothetical protein